MKHLKITEKIDVNKDLLLLLSIGGLYSLGIFLSNTFVNIYLWKQSGQFVAIALYNLAIYVLQPITFILAGKWAKKIDRVIVLRLGVIFLSLFFLTVLLSGEHAASYKLLLGGLLGIGYGFYWLAFNVLTFEITEPDTRDFFNGFLGLLQSFAGMIGPIVAGFLISRMTGNTGYTLVFGISFTLFFLSVITSMFLNRRPAKGSFSFRRIIKERRNNKNWRMVTNAHVLQGLREGTFMFIIAVWVFITTQSEFALGKFNFTYSAMAFVFYFLVTRFLKPRYRKGSIFAGGLMLYLALSLILIELSFETLLIYAGLIGIAIPIFFVPYLSLTYDVIGKSWKAAEMRIEYIVVRELYLNLGRVSSILLFITAVTLFPPERIIPYVLLTVGAGHFLTYFFIKQINFTSPKQEQEEEAFPFQERMQENENR
ncbi:MFS transporter [Bacillaceae bacterium S4-13-58]